MLLYSYIEMYNVCIVHISTVLLSELEKAKQMSLSGGALWASAWGPAVLEAQQVFRAFRFNSYHERLYILGRHICSGIVGLCECRKSCFNGSSPLPPPPT